MKKISYFCLLIVITFSALLLSNVYETKDTIRLNEIEMKDPSFRFYVKDSQKSIQEQLSFFEELAQNEHVSIFRTDVRNNIIVKSVVFDKKSFPFNEFNLPHTDLFAEKSEIYKNYGSVENNSSAKIPTITKSKILLQSLENYYKDSSVSLNGIYSVVGTDDLNSEKIMNQLSEFFGVSQEDLLSKPIQQEVGLVNRSLMIFIAIIISTFLILIIVNIYTPLMQLKRIGVSKLNGIPNLSIFFDFIKNSLLVIVIASLVIDIFLYFYYDYHPYQFFLYLILSQIVIILLFLLTNTFTFLTIRNVTISKMLKNFLNFKFGVMICYFVKLMISFLVTMILLQVSTDIDTLIKQYKINDSWQKNGNVLTLETYKLVDDDFQNFLLSNGKFEEKLANLYAELEEKTDVNFIYSTVVNPNRNLAVPDPHMYTEDETYEVMEVNDNYIESLDLSIDGSSVSSGKDDPRIFFVPKSYKDNKNIVYLCQNILFDSFDSEQQEAISLEDLSVTINYYDDKDFEVFSYAESENPIFTKPIFMTMNSTDITWYEKILLANTGLNNPLKLENTKSNQEVVKNIIDKDSYKNLNLKFSSINSILGDITSSYKQSIQIFSVILVFLFLLSVFTSVFLVNCIVFSDRKKIAIHKLFGFKLFDRYNTLFIIFSSIYLVQLLCVFLFSKTILLIPYILLTLLIDGTVIVQVIMRKEKNSLSTVLKGE
ncbi:hypothetical protein [Enterococcus sp. OL5]|uniref:hypothetical protein n=1 Tax=Enterococcus sp. OL5 TaxID=2590214 RepID=UPI001127E826|nr:hypothetical protein [Enterococcus sp. OL5]TPR56915.1 hypothetical protein FJU10_11110 [Enterococcus sp. OL5]